MATVLTRRTALAAAVLILAASCSTKPSASTNTVGSTLVTLPGATATTAPADGAPGPTRAGSPRTPRPDKTPSTSVADDAALRAAANDAPGRLAGFVLAPGPVDAVVLDVMMQAGADPDAATLASIRQILAAASGKPVTVRGPTTIDASSSEYDADDIRGLADANGVKQGSGTAAIHVVYLRGKYRDAGALGVTVRGDTFAVFPDQIARIASPFVTRARAERAVVTHEIGHVLGLVDLYLNDDRDDPDHPGHSTNPQSVMYWAVDADIVGQVLNGPPPVDFDGADQNDLRRIHQGAPPAG